MATVDRWLLPDGIEEVLPPEAARIEAARRQVLDLFHRWGYEFVVTPHIEYLESLLTGAGQDLDLRTFKVTDPASGRLMGFRADITPQVARMDAHSLRREGPSRLCYAGSVLHAQPRALSTSRSPIQLGAELYGDPSPASDVEVISLMLEMLEMAEVPDVHMDLGHVGIYRGLARAAGLSGEVEQQLFDALQRKAVDEVEALTADLPAELRGMLRALAELCGGRDALEQGRARLAAAPADVQVALNELIEIADSLAARASAAVLGESAGARLAGCPGDPLDQRFQALLHRSQARRLAVVRAELAGAEIERGEHHQLVAGDVGKLALVGVHFRLQQRGGVREGPLLAGRHADRIVPAEDRQDLDAVAAHALTGCCALRRSTRASRRAWVPLCFSSCSSMESCRVSFSSVAWRSCC